MTAHKTRPHATGLAAADFPVLESFFSGYLHEDFVAEHGSTSGARRAYRADADEDELHQFDREATRLLAAAETLPFENVAEFVRRDLGASWRPANLGQLRLLLAPSADRRR